MSIPPPSLPPLPFLSHLNGIELLTGFRETLVHYIQRWRHHFESGGWQSGACEKFLTVTMLNGMENLHYEERRRHLGLMSLKTRRVGGDSIEVFKFLNGGHAIDAYIAFF